MIRRAAVLFAAFILVIGQVTSAVAAPPASSRSAPIDKSLLKTLEAGPTRFLVEFDASADLRGAAKLKDHGKRVGFVVNHLKATAKSSQAEALGLVAKVKGANAKSYWLANTLVVTGDLKLARKLATLKGVSSIHPPKIYPLVKPVETKVAILAAAGDPEWGVEKIGADQVWADGITGSGIVVSSIDTGVDFSHPALVGNYRGNNHDGTFTHDYNWWDPSSSCPGEPCDNVGHGTHTMGTIAGGDGPGPFTPDTGVAPGAEWISAKGCEDFGCTSESLLSSGQFILAPTDLAGNNPNPALAPDVVSNSWGSDDPNDTFYLAAVQAWRAAGIIPVFAAGNAGDGCGSAGTPGNFTEVISLGATDINDQIAPFSSRGPSPTGKVSPNVSAPGVDVVSSVPGGGYEAFSGTSMATPHAAGTIALMLSAKSGLLGDFDGVLNALDATAIDRPDDTCGTPDPSDNDPNYVYGDGRIDAKAAVDLVKSGGTLSGTVTDSATSAPISGARVAASNGVREFVTTADATGNYSIFLAAGTYAVTAGGFGYASTIASGVPVITDTTTDQDFALVALPRFHVNGHVTASEDGSPIEGAAVVALGTPVPAAVSGADGSYSLELPIGDYTLRASAGGCTEVATAAISLVDADITQDFSLFRKLDDFGHGCGAIAFDWVDATTQTGLYGDEFAGRLRLPFDFDFYGATYQQLFLSDNGYLNFLAPDQYNGFPIAIPSTSVPNAAIYPFWQDLAVDADSSIDYATIGSAPDRAFVIEYSAMKVFGSSARVSFEVKLWEDGRIDMLYGANPASPGDGRNAGIGIENAAGTDALQFSFLDGLITPNSAFRYEHVPSGIVHGVVTDANDGLPIGGAHITATPAGRTATTAADGTYSLRLRPGSYTLAATATNYVTSTSPLTVADGDDLTADFDLDASVAVVDPLTVTATVDFGETTDVNLTLSNTGSGPLEWVARERNQGVILPPLPTPTSVVIRKANWGAVAIPRTFPRTVIKDLPAVTLQTIITDPAGDSLDANDVTTVRGGSDGSAVASMAIDFAPTTNMSQIGGFLYFDTDQNPSTGLPAEALYGKPGQDLGMEYFGDLFEANGSDPFVPIFSADTFELVAIVPATVVDHTIAFDMPLAALGNDDGFINTGMVVGYQGPSDWAPDTGHGTIEPYSDVPWLTETPDSGTINPGNSQVVTLRLGTATLAPGEYHAQVVFVTNAPKQTQLPVDVTFTVSLPPDFGAVTGTVTDAHTSAPLGGVVVAVHTTFNGSPLELTATTAGDGTYAVTGPAGTWTADYSLDAYVPLSQPVTIVAGITTPGADAVLHRLQPHAAIDSGPLTFILTPDRTNQAIVNLSNPGGHEDLTFKIGEVNLDATGDAIAAAAHARTLPAGARSDARTTKGIFGPSNLAIPPAIRADGDVLASWNAEMSLPWGVAYSGEVWLSDPIDQIDVQFTTGGARLGQFANPTNGEWGGDMAFDRGRDLIWQVNVGGDNGIYGINPADGSVAQVITGAPWSNTSQRGLAYDPAADVFYVGGWNEGIVYRVAGPGPTHATPGETLSQCTPADGSISGLAWNGSFNLLWEQTNSETDTIFLLDPATCATVRALSHPDGGGYGGAGLETDVVGNLWTVGQNTGKAYLVESGLPNFSDVPWLSVDPTEGSVAPDGSQPLTITVDSTGLATGVYHAIVVIQTNDPDNSNIQVPVTLVVPTYQQGVNAGGGAYLDPANGNLFGADRPYSAGGFGYVGASSTRTSTAAIAGTTRDPLYQDQRAAMSAYRFAVPNGTYRVDLSFAELQQARTGSRVFAVGLEGSNVLTNFDVYAAAGGRYIALDRSFLVEVTDGILDISFAAQRGDKPIINAILVTEMPTGSPG